MMCSEHMAVVVLIVRNKLQGEASAPAYSRLGKRASPGKGHHSVWAACWHALVTSAPPLFGWQHPAFIECLLLAIHVRTRTALASCHTPRTFCFAVFSAFNSQPQRWVFAL
jgi:hypothetical protein